MINKTLCTIFVSAVILVSILLCSCTNDEKEEPSTNPSTEARSEKAESFYDKTTSTLTIQGNGVLHCEEKWEEIKNPRNVIIEPGVSEISDYCFGYSPSGEEGIDYNHFDKIETVTLPNTVERIGKDAFRFCSALKTINLPDGIKNIGENAFGECENLTEIKLPGSLTSLNYGAFYDCEKLKTIEFNEGLRKIGDEVFRSCELVEGINLPLSLTEIGEGAFSGWSSLKSLTIPDNVEKIGNYAFGRSENLCSVTLSKSLKFIGERAFLDCDIKSISIPKSVTTIGEHAFGYKEKLIDSTWEHYPIKDFTVNGYKGTAAEKYAKKNGFKFVALN